MSGLLFLTQEDFLVTNGQKGPVLSNSLKGFSLVLFYSTQCDYCKELIPIFKNLPGTTGGCQFGMINVTTNKNIVAISKQTVTPLTYVPYIVLYVNGKPFMAYQGPSNEDDIRNFVIEVAHKLQKKQKFTPETEERIIKAPKRAIPEYTVGIPKNCDDGVCYLTDSETWK
jgi:thioredoxin-like negative regulator of GroEL